MKEYQALSKEEGAKYFANISNLMFTPITDPNFFVQPWTDMSLRDCAEFKFGAAQGGFDEVVFLAFKELNDFIRQQNGELYLYGAYGVIQVCQMRALGRVVPLLHESDIVQELIQSRTELVKSGVGVQDNRLDSDGIQERLAILNTGQAFRFVIESYAFKTYTRG